MKHNWIRKIFFGVIAFTGFVLLFGYGLMWLWNTLVPALFSGPVITFWQAIGLLVLSKILFGGFRGGRHWGKPRGPWGARMRARWENMNEEERAKFRHWCGYSWEQPKAQEQSPPSA
jgi:hypothetical protein